MSKIEIDAEFSISLHDDTFSYENSAIEADDFYVEFLPGNQQVVIEASSEKQRVSMIIPYLEMGKFQRAVSGEIVTDE